MALEITRNKIRDHFRQQQGRAQGQGGADAQWWLVQIPDQPPKSTVDSAPSNDAVSVLHGLLAGIHSRFADYTWLAFWAPHGNPVRVNSFETLAW